MSWMDEIGGLVKQYAGGSAGSPAEVDKHYDQVVQAAPASTIAGALGDVFRSNETPAFGQLAGQLFGASNGSQQASVLNTLLTALGPAALSGVLSGGRFPGLSSILGGGGTQQVSAAQAAQVPAQEIQDLAAHVEKHDPSVVDRVSEVYAQHPQLVKTLGSAALAIALAKIAQRTQG